MTVFFLRRPPAKLTAMEPKNHQRLIIIDGNAVIHRAFHAIPPLSTTDGLLVNAAYGFLTILFKAIKELKPTHLAVTFDVAGGTFRHAEYKEYKATRVKQPDELYAQIPVVKEILAAAGVPVYEKKGFEADDVIGTLTARVSDADSVVVTGDMDTLQLVDKHTRVYAMRKGMTDTVVYDEAAVRARYGFDPAQLIDYKGLRGDASDNIKGVGGIGEKTATELVVQFGSVEKMYAALEAAAAHKKVAAGVTARVQKILLEQKESALMSKKLVTIMRDVPIEFNLADTKFLGMDRDALFPVLQKYNFLSLMNRLPSRVGGGEEEKKSSRTRVARGPVVSLVTEPSGAHALVAKLRGEPRVAVFVLASAQRGLFGDEAPVIGFCWGREVAAVTVNSEKIWDELGRFFMEKKVELVAHDVKSLMHVLAQHGIVVGGEIFDVMVAAYLLQAGTRAHDLPNLVITILGEDVPVTEWAHGDPTRAGRGAERVWRIAEKLRAEMAEKNVAQLFEDIEMPLVGPLARMERYGIALDTKYLGKTDEKLSGQLEKICKKIYKMAGREFNVASPQQVGELLFTDLKLSAAGIKRGKTRISTAAGELEKLQGMHPVIDLILEHREIAKLLNTYVQALPKLVAADGRVHTSYNQVVAATGRLSSQDPNLQNIPVRTELGREIRRAFVAADGFALLSCDYSQIELRIVAHLAGDKKLIEIFEQGLDVHRATAAEIHGVALADVTKDQRFSAKEINFGVLYGMGAWGVAGRTGLPLQQARAFVEKYMATFSGVAKFLEETKSAARERGFAETLFGRRRYIPELSSGVAAVRAAGERMAVNMPIQGAQADIIKMAMVAVDKMLVADYGVGIGVSPEERDASARMLLQVHDELIFEVREKLVEEVREKILKIMMGVAKLSVPLKVDSAVGDSWADLD